MTLVVGDTAAHYFAYDYEPATGTVGPRRIFGDMSDLPGGPDGATLDADEGLWCALFGGAAVVRFTNAGLDRTIEVPVTNPTDVTFGDPVPDPLNLVSFACSQGTPVGSFCEVGSIASGASVIATLVATPITNPARSERKFTNTAFISESGTTDPNAGNDTASLDLHISGKTP